MPLIFKTIDGSSLEEDLVQIIDSVSEGTEAIVVQHASDKGDVVVLSYNKFLDILQENKELHKEINNLQLQIAELHLSEGDFESFTMNEDGTRNYF